MANKKIKINVDLDFTSDQMSLEKVRDQIDNAIEAVEINLDPKSATKFKKDLEELGKYVERHLNKNTGKIDAKNLMNDLSSNSDLKALRELGPELAGVGVHGTRTFNELTTQSNYLNRSLTESNSILSKMGTTLMNTIRWNISASAVNAVTSEFQKMYYFAKDLDRTLTDIRIVSGQTADQMERFAIHANESAKALKVSTIEYAQAATLFYQQGLGDVDVRKMTDGAVMASRITGVAAADMADLLTSTMNGYKLAADEVMTVTDKLAAVGATTASNFEELSTGMSKVASMASTAGVTIDELNAQLATIIAVTRESPESIGMSLKTIYGRMLMFKTDTKALMKDDDGEVFGAPKVEEALQAYNRIAGEQISLFKTTKDGKRELRDLGEVIEEIGDSWDDVTDRTAKFGLATALAGSRQQNRLVALFDSWDMYKDAVETSLNAEGTTLKQNAIYMESYEGRLKGLQAAKEEMYMVFTDSDSMKGFISGLTKAVEMFSKLADAAGGFNLVIAGIGAVFSQSIAKKGIDLYSSINKGLRGQNTSADKEELKMTEQLEKIKKVYGAEEANRLRDTLNTKKELLKVSATENDLIAEEHTLTSLIGKTVKENEGATQDGKIQNLMVHNEHLGISADRVRLIQEEYQLLKIAEQELADLRLRAAEGSATDNIDAAIEKATEQVADLKMDVDHTMALIENRKFDSDKVVGFRESGEKNASRELADQHAQAQKVLQVTDMVRTASMTIPVAIKLATDESTSFGGVLGGIGASTIPMLLSGLMKAAPAMMAATAGAASFGAGLTAALAAALPIVGPILAIGAGVAAIALVVKAINDSTVTFAKSMKELEKASEELVEQERAYEAIEQQLEQIKTRREEIDAIGDDDDTTDEEKERLEEELALLDIKYGRLEQELVIEEMLLQAAREKAEIAAQQAATATMSSDYSSSYDGHRSVTKDQVTVAEELEHATAAYIEAEDQILDYREALAKLKADEGSTARQIKRAQKDLDNATKARDKAADHVAEYSGAIREIIADLENEEGTNEDLIKSLEEYLDVSTDTIAQTLGIGEAFEEAAPEEFIEDVYEIIDQMEVLAEAYGDAAEAVETYGAFLDDLNSEEGLSIANRDKIIQKHHELIPYLGDEAALRDFLIQKIEEEEEAQMVAYINMLMDSEDFYNAKLKGNEDLQKELRDLYDIELSDFTSLAEAKGAVDQALIQALGQSWAQYYDTQTQSFNVSEEQWNNMSDHQRQQYRQLQRDSNNAKKHFEGLALKLAPIKLDRVGRSERTVASRGSKSSNKETKEKLAEADAYAKVNLELDKNNVLMTKNKTLQQNVGDDLAKKLELMDEEIDLNNQRKKLLHELNEEMRKEARELQNDLQGIFNFEGSWDDNSMVITNLEAIEGKSDVVEKKFNRILDIIKTLPKASQEWVDIDFGNIALEIKKITTEFELADQKMSKLQKTLSTLEYEFKLLDENNIDGKVENITKQIENLEQQLVDAQAELKSLGEVGEQSPKAIRDRFEELTKRIQDSTLAVKAHKKSLIDMREALRVEHVQKLNDAYSEQQDRLSKLESIQEKIVAIIRKRGEEEKKQLDENHNAEMDSLEERHNERKKKYQEETDLFKKMIQDKIDALDEQYEEEDYLEGLQKERDKANEIQKQIDVLSLDDSLTARNKVIELRKKLADQNEVIAKKQQKKERDVLKKSLQDQIKDHEKDAKDRESIADKTYENEKKRLEEDYKINNEFLDRKYSDEQVYAEAKEAILRGQVEVTKGVFMDIYDAFVDFENKFGKGMGILGDIIRDEFNESLREAQRLLRETSNLSNNILSRPNPDRYYSDDEIGWKDPKPEGSSSSGGSSNSSSGSLSSMSRSDYNTYVQMKQLWEMARASGDTKSADYASSVNKKLRNKYGITSDLYSWSQLKNIPYEQLKLLGYDRGGKIDYDGLAMVHGEDNPEWVLRDDHLKKIISDSVLSTIRVSMPKMPNVSPRQGITLQIDNFIKADNITKDSIPELKKVQANAMEDLKNLLNKNGVRPSLI